MFSSKKKVESEVIGVIDIGSARVSGALIVDWPKITHENSESVEWQEIPDWDRFQAGIEQSLKAVVKKLAKGRHKKPKEIFVFLSAPFFVGNTRLIKTKDKNPFEITPPFLAGLVKKDIFKFDRGQKGNLVRIENEIMTIKLDGYPVGEPLGQMASEVDLSHWQSEGHVSIMDRLQEIIEAEFPEIKINFHSFAYATYAVFNELLPEKNWILIDTGNELTDIIVIKDGYLAEHLSFPIGKNTLIRLVAKTLGTVPAETESTLNRYASGRINKILKSRLESTLEPIASDWIANLNESLSRALETTILPETFYIFGDEPSDKIFSDFIKEGDFSAISISHKPPQVYYVDKPLHQALSHLEGKKSPTITNSFLLAESLFCAMIKDSKLNLWPFNQLSITMSDIIKNKKSLRDIFPDNKVGNKTSDVNKSDSEEVTFKTSSYKPAKTCCNPGGISLTAKIFAAILVLAIILAGGFALSNRFAKVTVKVTPKQGRLMISNTYEASKSSETGLKFSLASNIEAEDKISVPASGTEMVKTKARGQIIIYNTTKSSQALVATTRFETPEGLIYRIEKGVTVPPGQLEVTVFADKTGPKYNIDITDFTIPGFKGSTKFTQFYARSKTAMTGGEEGEQPKVSESDMAEARATLEQKILETLAGKLAPQVPEDYVLFDGAILANFIPEISKNPANPKEAELTLKAKATGLLFNKNELASYLAKQQVADYNNEVVDITNWSTFKFSLVEKEDVDPSSLEKINFKLEGTGHLVWIFDTKDLKDKLQSAGSSNYKLVFDEHFPMIQVANIVFTPPWIRSIPSDQGRILVETNINKP
jgi:cell division ATPase FtsA